MFNSKITIKVLLVILGVSGLFFFSQRQMDSEARMNSQETNETKNNTLSRMGSMMGNDQESEIIASNQAEQELRVPPVLKPTSKKNNKSTYEIVAKEGEIQLKEGEKTKTLGYNGDFLGPVIQLEKGQTVTINTKNELKTETSFHWHGLKVPSSADGGPHQVLAAGQQKEITFTVDQEAATLWFHPHPEGETASQVYRGLAGLMYIEDERSKSLKLPDNYGENDFPLIVQDRSFDDENQLNYEGDFNSDGTTGNTLVVNGTINPYVNVHDRWIRYRIVNGSNARNFTFSLDTSEPFYQIATDGGLLNSAVKLSSLTLSPGERAEIVVDTKNYKKGETLQLIANQTSVLRMKMNSKNSASVNEFKPSTPLNTIPTIAKNDLTTLNRQIINLKGMSHMVSINNRRFDMERIDLIKEKDTKEIWEVNNNSSMMGGMIHPFHIHGVQFQILSRNGKQPPANERGWKDTVLVNPTEKVELLVTFNQAGIFMYHCHILEHEEYGMMGQMKVV